jgi:hypothetical protein
MSCLVLFCLVLSCLVLFLPSPFSILRVPQNDTENGGEGTKRFFPSKCQVQLTLALTLKLLILTPVLALAL